MSVDIGGLLAAVRKLATAARPTAEASLTLGIDMGGILVRSEPLAINSLGPVVPPPNEIKKPLPPKVPSLLDEFQDCRGITVEVDGKFSQQGTGYLSSIG